MTWFDIYSPLQFLTLTIPTLRNLYDPLATLCSFILDNHHQIDECEIEHSTHEEGETDLNYYIRLSNDTTAYNAAFLFAADQPEMHLDRSAETDIWTLCF